MLYLNGKLFNTKNTDPDYEHAKLVKEYHDTIKEVKERYGKTIVLETRQRPHPDKITGFSVFPGTKGLLKRTTLIDDGGNAQEWIWSPTTLKKVDGEIILTDPNLLIHKGSYPVDVEKTPDLVYYFLKSRKVGKTEEEGKKYHLQDNVAKTKISASKRKKESEVTYKIYTAITEPNLRTLAKSWGISMVDTKHIDVVREELYLKVEFDEKAKKTGTPGHRGYDEFLESADVKFDDKVGALVRDAEEKGFVQYDVEGRKWVIDYKDGGSLYPLKELGGNEFGDPLRALTDFLTSTPDALKKVENIMNRPLARPEDYDTPAFPLTLEQIQDTKSVLTLKKYIKDYTDQETSKTMKAAEAREILFQALAASNAEG